MTPKQAEAALATVKRQIAAIERKPFYTATDWQRLETLRVKRQQLWSITLR